jgi:uncharacterized membrane protein YccC
MNVPALKPASRGDQVLMLIAAATCVWGLCVRFVEKDSGRSAVGLIALGAMMMLQSVGALMVSMRWRRTLFGAAYAIGLAWLVYFQAR